MRHKQYKNEFLIFNACNKSYKSSKKNHQKLENMNIEHGKKYLLGDNIWISFLAGRNQIRKTFFRGDRPIKKDTAIRRLDLDNLK